MYTLAFYETMCIEPSSFQLPQQFIENINTLHLHLGIQNTSAKPKTGDGSGRRTKQDVTDNWKKKEEFKATSIIKKVGYDILIGELKKFLNKLTSANYDVYIENVVETVSSIVTFDFDGDNNRDTALEQVVNVILQVACSNKYYSMLYAKLYTRLFEVHSYFTEENPRIYDNFITALHAIETVDPNVDYDRFCVVNKKNDERRALMLFIINSYKIGSYTLTQLSNVVLEIDGMIHTHILDSKYIEYTNELTEIMNVFVTNMVTNIKGDESWCFVKDRIVQYSQYKTKDYPGMSSRTIFKYMDMVDLFK